MPPENDDSQNVDTTQANLGNMVNAAVASHIKRFTEKQLPQLLEAALKPITEKLSAPPPVVVTEEEPAAKGKKNQDPELAALKKQLDEFKAAAEKSELGRVAAEKKQREDRAFSDMKTSLAPHVRPELLEVLANHLFSTQKRVEFEDDGTPIFKSVSRNSFGIEDDVRLPIKDGIDSFLKSDEAKPFLPAPGVSTAPGVKRSANPSQLPQNFDLSKATPEQKTQYANQLETRLAAEMKTRGFDV